MQKKKIFTPKRRLFHWQTTGDPSLRHFESRRQPHYYQWNNLLFGVNIFFFCIFLSFYSTHKTSCHHKFWPNQYLWPNIVKHPKQPRQIHSDIFWRIYLLIPAASFLIIFKGSRFFIGRNAKMHKWSQHLECAWEKTIKFAVLQQFVQFLQYLQWWAFVLIQGTSCDWADRKFKHV